TATPNTGYQFKEWQVISGGVTIENNKFIMPAANVTIKAVFEPIPPVVEEYLVTFDANGGTASVTSVTTSGGKLESLPDAFRTGYIFTGWYTENGELVTMDTVFTKDTTLYAGWRFIPVYVPDIPSYNPGGSSSGSTSGGNTGSGTVKPSEPEIEWVRRDGYTYLYIDSKMITGWYQEENGDWYWFDEDTGIMSEDCWEKIDNVWYAFDDTGVMATGWRYIDGYWYYFKDWGGMVTGWQYIDGVWYYFYSSGVMAANAWVQTSGYWYYLTGSGAMATARWIEWKGDWYYLYSSGIMATNATIDGYYVNSNGVWVQ
ncbi:MAG TPA: InlB B-repeat-containing protein, partial [Candidatus Faecivivens stercorigallinarum]|nr:InlB B-repeat-containing protein [Candidatus Faecivivens stercorigallinarum]